MTYMLSEIYEEPLVLKRLEEENKEVLIKLAAELKRRNIRHITFAARGTSDHACIYGQYLMSILGGINAGLAVPSCISLYGADIFYGDSLVIAISQSGSAADALEVINKAKANGAITLAITNFKQSILANSADMHLWCAAGEEKSVAATKTFTAQLGLLVLLAAYWFDRADLLNDFNRLPNVISDLINRNSIESLAVRYRYIDDGFVLSRGISYPVALETMLKIQETCYVKLKAYSSADFRHGPLAQLDAGSPVIIYAQKGKAQKENLDIAQKVLSIGAEPLIVTDDESICKGGLHYLLPDVKNELLFPIVAATFAQLFAQSLCLLRGLNPDRPRNLCKITVTK